MRKRRSGDGTSFLMFKESILTGDGKEISIKAAEIKTQSGW